MSDFHISAWREYGAAGWAFPKVHFLFIGDFDDRDDYNDWDTYFKDDIQFLERGGATTFKGKIRARPTIAVQEKYKQQSEVYL